MLYINEGDNVPLPKKYHKINNLCAVLYDQLTEVFVKKNYKDLLSTAFTFDPQKHTELTDSGENILDWLNSQNLNKELNIVIVKHITLSILSDFLNFVYESLSCARKGKMTIAYALLRKPFTDELLILEQLSYDSEDFIKKFFHSGNPTDYDPGPINPDNKKEIIRNALGKFKASTMFSESFLYELRYDKNANFGFNGLSNQALHIVTTNKNNYKTTNQNFNFVFSNIENVKSYWEHYYSFVPYLLLYSISVIDSIIFECMPISKNNEELKAVRLFKRIIALLLRNDYTSKKKGNKIKSFSKYSQLLNMYCQNCKKHVKLSKGNFELFFENEDFYCPTCLKSDLQSSVKIKDLVSSLL